MSLFGLTQKEYNFLVTTVVKPFAGRSVKFWCYGSRARGDHSPFSDIDVMVETKLDLSSDLSEIREQLENSNFPYKVDLVEYQNFAEAYKENYAKEKQPLT